MHTKRSCNNRCRATKNYQKTGDLITLPYTHVTLAEQQFATKTENVQPYLLASFIGKIELSPSGDEWFETETAPAVIINREGNFDSCRSLQIKMQSEQFGMRGKQLGVVLFKLIVLETHVANGNPNNRPTRLINVGATAREDRQRTGLRTRVVENVVEEDC